MQSSLVILETYKVMLQHSQVNREVVLEPKLALIFLINDFLPIFNVVVAAVVFTYCQCTVL